MGRIPGTSDFKGLGHYRSAEEIPGIKVVRFDAPLYFANAELFILSVNNACGLNPVVVKSKLVEKAAEEKAMSAEVARSQKTVKDMQLRVIGRRLTDASIDSVVEDPTEHVVTQLTHIIIDCSTIPYIDLMGKDALVQIYADYATIDITVLIANCKVALRQLFETSDFYQKVPKNRMFVSLNDAVSQALKEQRQRYPERPPMALHTDSQHKPKPQEPVALSPAQKTLVTNIDEGEEQTQSVASTVSTQRVDHSAIAKKDNTVERKGILKLEKKNEEKPKKEDKTKEEHPKKDEKKKDEKKKDDPKLPIWRRPFVRMSKKEEDKTQ